MVARYVTFGEIMLRLKPPGAERFFQSPLLEATFGGGEANVAVALAGFGCEAAFVSVIPRNAVGDACIGELRRRGVDTSRVVRRGSRLGIYFLEGGANQRPSVATEHIDDTVNGSQASLVASRKRVFAVFSLESAAGPSWRLQESVAFDRHVPGSVLSTSNRRPHFNSLSMQLSRSRRRLLA